MNEFSKREYSAINMAIAFIQISPAPLQASIGDEDFDKEDILNILRGIGKKMKGIFQ